MVFKLIWILSIVSQVHAGPVSKKCLDFFEAVLSEQTNKSAIPVECPTAVRIWMSFSGSNSTVSDVLGSSA
jgi:hypothetical protein